MFPLNTRSTAFAIIVAILAFACGVEEEQRGDAAAPGGELTPRTIGSTTGASTDFWPPPDVTISRAEAIEIALRSCTGSAPEVTEVEDPHNPVARLMTRGEYEERQGGSSNRDPSALIWVVQFEGESYGGGITTAGGAEPPLFRYVGCDINAQTGDVQGGFRRVSEPFLLPLQVIQQIPNEIPDSNYGIIVPTNGVAVFSRDDVLALLNEKYGNRNSRPERAEIELVAYTETAGLPNAPPTPIPPTSTPPPVDETVTPRPEATSRPLSIDRLVWLVIVPTDFGYNRCLLFGPIGRDTRPLCLSAADWMLIDAKTGERVRTGGSITLPSPRVTDDEYRALERFAWAEGWWELWHRVKDYAGERLPAGLAARLDRPDAPRPTPYPTSTPDPNAPPRPTPTPAPTDTPTLLPEPTPQEVILSTMTVEPSEEEDARIRATAEAESPGRIIYVTGPMTAGSLIVIADREIQLPADTWVKSRAVAISCVEGQECPPTPYHILQRGNSTIEIDAAGKIWGETISPGETTPFAFLKDLLQGR